jgi:hypothetical protein
MSDVNKAQLAQDWKQRDFTRKTSQNLQKVVDFLTDFGYLQANLRNARKNKLVETRHEIVISNL